MNDETRRLIDQLNGHRDSFFKRLFLSSDDEDFEELMREYAKEVRLHHDLIQVVQGSEDPAEVAELRKRYEKEIDVLRADLVDAQETYSEEVKMHREAFRINEGILKENKELRESYDKSRVELDHALSDVREAEAREKKLVTALNIGHHALSTFIGLVKISSFSKYNYGSIQEAERSLEVMRSTAQELGVCEVKADMFKSILPVDPAADERIDKLMASQPKRGGETTRFQAMENYEKFLDGKITLEEYSQTPSAAITVPAAEDSEIDWKQKYEELAAQERHLRIKRNRLVGILEKIRKLIDGDEE